MNRPQHLEKNVDLWPIAHVASFSTKYTIDQPRFQSKYTIETMVYSKFGQDQLVMRFAGGLEPIRNGEIF